MPKIDPVTGCTVLTMPEALDRMAQDEGKGRTGGDILADIWEEMDNEDRAREEHMSSPEGALEHIQTCIKEVKDYWDDDEDVEPLPEIVEILKVIEANYSQSFKESAHTFAAEVKDIKGRILFVETAHSYWSGTMLEPPESDTEFYFAEFKPVTVRPWKCLRCGKLHEKGGRHWTHTSKSDDPKLQVHVCPACNGHDRRIREKKYREMQRRNARKKQKLLKQGRWK